MRFIHIADVHLGMKPDKGYPWSEQRKEEIWQTFGRIIDRVNEADADLLLIAGDLFHGQPLIRELKEVNYLFGKLRRARVVMIAGNHDYLRQDSALNTFQWNENVVFLSQEEPGRVWFKDLKTTVYGFSYHQREIQERLYDNMYPDAREGYHILLAHGGDENHIPMDRKRIAEAGFDYVALGHIHRPEEIVKNQMAYCGAPEPTDINDTGKHGYIQGEFTDMGLSVKFVPFAKREYIHLNIKSDARMTDLAMEDAVDRAVHRYGRENMYRIKLTGYRDMETRYHPERYQGLGNILEISDETQPNLDIEELLRIHKGDVLGKFIEKLYDPDQSMGEIRKKALYYGLGALLEER